MENLVFLLTHLSKQLGDISIVQIPLMFKLLFHQVGKKITLKDPGTIVSWQEFSAHYAIINTNL